MKNRNRNSQERAFAPAMAAAEPETVATGADSFASEMDMDKVPESIRDDYFTPHPEDVEDDGYESDVLDEQAAEQTATDGDGEDGPQGRPGRSTEAMVWDINKIAQDTIEKGGLEIGEYVLWHVFHGDLKV